MIVTGLSTLANAEALLVLQCVLFILVTATPIAAALGTQAMNARIALHLSLLFYALDFGIRALFFVVAPEAVLYPSFSPTDDTSHVVAGLAWCGAGMLGLTAGYLLTEQRLRHRNRPLALESVARSLSSLSSTRTLLVLFAVGAVARAYAMSAGSAIWLYNSPAFDRIGVRLSNSIGGAVSLAADLCIMSWVAACALYVRTPKNQRSPLLLALPAVGILSDLVFNTYSLYKFGMLLVVLLLAITRAYLNKTSWKMLFLATICFVVIVIPFFNVARATILPYYVGTSSDGNGWVPLAEDARVRAVELTKQGGAEGILNGLIGRLNGAESIAVGDKLRDEVRVETGKTYGNLGWLLLPGFLRPDNWTPYYIDWAHEFVGLSRGNLTVIPLPAVVEAFLNFGWIGPPFVLALLGCVLAVFDKIGRADGMPILGVALAAYSVAKLLNIEHYVFIAGVSVMKMWLIAVAWHVAARLLRSSRHAAWMTA